MDDRPLLRASAAGMLALGIAVIALGGLASPAAAFTGDCSGATPAATLVADGVCEVRITTAGAATFYPPSGIAKLSAVLVGGGAGGVSSNTFNLFTGGDGGGVTYIDSVPLTSGIPISVGAGGAATIGSANTAPTGQSTLVGGQNAPGGGHTGIQCNTTENYNGTGARTGAVGTTPCAPGSGFTLSQLPGIDPVLFPSAADTGEVYGSGGASTGFGAEGTTGAVAAVAGTGGSAINGNSAPGSPGLVVFRFAAVAPAPAAGSVVAGPALAATGRDVSWWTPLAGAAAAGLGATLLVIARRRRPSRR